MSIGPPAWKPVDGWWCPCVGPGAGMEHHAAECPARLRIRTWIPTFPDWRMPEGLGAGGQVDDGGEDAPVLEPIVRCRELTADDPRPPAGIQLFARVRKLMPARLTYARGWGRRKVVVGYEPAEEGGGEIKGFRPWPVESVALRCRVLAVTWTRKEGDASWKPDGGYAVWGGRIWPVGITQAEALVKALEEGSNAAEKNLS